MTEVAAASQRQPTSQPSPNQPLDVDAVLASLSDLGQRVPPAEHIRVASFVPPYPDAPVRAFYTAIEPRDEWGSLPVPQDVAAALKPLLGLQSSASRDHPHMQGIYHLLAHELGCGRHMRRDAAGAGPTTTTTAGGVSYDPAVLFEWLMREDVRRSDAELRVADRSLPMPLYDPNKGFHESDIAAYTAERLLDERWGSRRAPLNADDLVTSSMGAVAADGGMDAADRCVEDNAAYRRPVSVHARGGLTWMQKALDSQSPLEDASDYFVYREQMTTAMGKYCSVDVRTDVASYPRAGQRETFYDAVLHRTSPTAAPPAMLPAAVGAV